MSNVAVPYSPLPPLSSGEDRKMRENAAYHLL